MLVKDQIKLRMQQLEISHSQLARFCQTSDQTVRHWTNGRCYPSKKLVPMLEQALSFKIDFGEGSAVSGQTVTEGMPSRDAELFNKIQRLPPEAKLSFEQLADQLLQQYPVAPFIERTANGSPRVRLGEPMSRRQHQGEPA